MKARHVAVWGVALTIMVALMLFYVWKGWRAGALAVRVDALKAEQQELLDQQNRLRAEATSLSSVERIKTVAVQQLGLVEPPLTPVDVPAVAPLGPRDSVEANKATGTELWRGGENVTPAASAQ